MAVPTTRAEFKDYCLRRLGSPVIEINVDDDQVEDRIDDALKYYWDYHFDGTERQYYKYKVTGQELDGAANTITIQDGGTLYSNNDTVVITGGSGAAANVVTDGSGVITGFNFDSYGDGYSNTDTVTVTTSTGSGAALTLVPGDGSFTLPENIIGAVRIFPIADPAISSDDLFNIRYQIALNDLYTLTSVSMVPYYMVMQHLAVIQDLLVGQQPIRYNRHTNRIYCDMNWSFAVGKFLLVEAYQIVDPEVYQDVWKDQWLSRYATAHIKRQWGSNLTKFIGMQLPGGLQFNGQRIYDDSVAELSQLEEEMIMNYSLPVLDMIG